MLTLRKKSTTAAIKSCAKLSNALKAANARLVVLLRKPPKRLRVSAFLVITYFYFKGIGIFILPRVFLFIFLLYIEVLINMASGVIVKMAASQ